MKRFISLLTLLCVLAASAFASADKQAKQLYEKGKDAEVRQDYIAAYNLYEQAYRLHPSDLSYRASAEYVRFLASASYVHKGQALMAAGKLQEALTDYEQALAIDPSQLHRAADDQQDPGDDKEGADSRAGAAIQHRKQLGQAHGRGALARLSWRPSRRPRSS